MGVRGSSDFLLTVNKMRGEMTCMASVHIQQAAHAHLAVHDLQDDVTNDMRGILKSEEKWNVLEREGKNDHFNGVSQRMRSHPPTVSAAQGDKLLKST